MSATTESLTPALVRPVMFAVLQGRLLRDDASKEDEDEAAVGVVLRNGTVLSRVAVWDFECDGAIVRLHDLNDQGRRLYVLVDEIVMIRASRHE